MERYDLLRDGNISFFDPNSIHDDVLWSTTLAIYATSNMAPELFLAVVTPS